MLKVRELLTLGLTTPFTFQVPTGSITAVIGKNGSGKSLLLDAISVPDSLTSGIVSINHLNSSTDHEKFRHLLGYVPNPVIVEEYLTGIEFLELISSTYHLLPKDRLEEILTLADALECRSELYSLLQLASPSLRQKIGLIAAALHQPKVLIVDEPWAHLDPTVRRRVTNYLKDHAGKQRCVVVGTNDLESAEEIADRVLVVANGSLLVGGTITELAHQYQTKKSLREIWCALEERGQLG